MPDPIVMIQQQQLQNQLLALCAPNFYDSVAYEASKQVSSKASGLIGFSGYSSNAAAQFIQVHDSASVPAAGAIPLLILTVVATGNFSWNPIMKAKFFKSGIFIGNSTTGPTYTAGAADTWFSVMFY